MEHDSGFDYGFYVNSLKECFCRFGDIFQLPIIRGPYAETKKNYAGGNILDLGAGKELPLKEILKLEIRDGKYYSLDNDPLGIFDFNSLVDIPPELKFSFISANQFFEHLTVSESIKTIKAVSGKMITGGMFIATVPNISHPNRQLSHIDHRTGWGYNSFYALFKLAGLEVVKIARYSKRHPRGPVEWFITHYVSRVYRMDWCDSILIIGKK